MDNLQNSIQNETSVHTVDVITMGCSKNLVDSEKLISMFREHGIQVYHNPDHTHGDVAVINTCGFIGDAKEESINEIIELCNLKTDGELNKVLVMGCLSERYLNELREEIPEVDKFYGKFNWTELLGDLLAEWGTPNATPNACGLRVTTTPAHYAYIKISEGCNRKCAYCAIPLITGPHKSRPMDEILDEVRGLVKQGVKEFQIIAQELTYYGVDLYKEQRLPQLIEQMAEIPGVEWIRLHYAYPTHFPMDLLRVMREHSNVCNYLDIALQHISDSVLERMQRHISKQQTIDLIEAMRREVPRITIRTTLMVGFPGETDEDFNELMEFTRQARFDRMGAFAYSEEEGTYAAEHYKDDVPEDVKAHRLDQLMALQQDIATELSEDKVGKTFRVIIDRKEGDYFIGRTEADSPDVDCEVLIAETEGTNIEIGNFYNVTIDNCEEFDLYGSISD